MTLTPLSPLPQTLIKILELTKQLEKTVAGAVWSRVCLIFSAGSASAVGLQTEVDTAGVTISVTGQASINLPLTTTRYYATITGCRWSNITWMVNNILGGSSTVGTISTRGVYQAPSIMPSQNRITINAVSTYCTPYSGNIAVTLLQPIPVVTTARATSSDGGNTVQVKVTAKNMVDGAALLVQGTKVRATTVSSLELAGHAGAP